MFDLTKLQLRRMQALTSAVDRLPSWCYPIQWPFRYLTKRLAMKRLQQAAKLILPYTVAVQVLDRANQTPTGVIAGFRMVTSPHRPSDIRESDRLFQDKLVWI